MPVRVQEELPRQPTAAGLARRLVGQRLGLELDHDELEQAKLLTSELVNNAVLHGVGRIDLIAEVDRDRIRIDVVDQGSGFTHQVRRVGFYEVSGRGLQIVDSVASRWGLFEGTTHVWFELERSGPRLQAE